jgi:hypothetical protein
MLGSIITFQVVQEAVEFVPVNNYLGFLAYLEQLINIELSMALILLIYMLAKGATKLWKLFTK